MQGKELHIWLNRQADRMERILSSLALPSRVSGGRVSEGGIEYRLRPMLGTQAGSLMEAADHVADRLGVRAVRATSHGDEVAMEIPRHATGELRLLPFMRSLGDIGELTAVVGRNMDMGAELLPLRAWRHAHLIVQGSTSTGKSELLRTLLISLALTSRPSQVALLGIDIGGRELTALEAIPHRGEALATRPQAAVRMIERLRAEATRRRLKRIASPRIACFIDDLAWLSRDRRCEVLKHLLHLIEFGGHVGMHIFAGLRTPSMRLLAPLAADCLPQQVCSLLAIESGTQYMRTFEMSWGGEPRAVQAAWMSVHDIDRAVGMLTPVEMPAEMPKLDPPPQE